MIPDPIDAKQQAHSSEDWTAGFSTPLERFLDLFHRARTAEPFDHTAVVLASSTADGVPSARVVLLKAADEDGFMFVTNYEGRKGRELRANPRAALCFHYPTLNEQCRVEGIVVQCAAEESDGYFASRPRTSQIGAWVSQQSRPLGSRQQLMDEVERLKRQFEGQSVPRPPHWGGFRVKPLAMEFWRDGEFRLHDRFRYERDSVDSDQWRVARLWP